MTAETDNREWLYGLQKFGMKLGLENIHQLSELLERPERRFESILVAGTNGKGSVSAMLEAILRETGASVGLYTSPHLVRPEERIRIGGRDIDSAAFDATLAEVRAIIERELASRAPARGALPEGGLQVGARQGGAIQDGAMQGGAGQGVGLNRHPTFFEVMTAMAFLAFARAKIDVAVLEVGLGGRFDATNIVEPTISIVTGIDLDHQEQLGDTLAKIAREKAGVFRDGRPAFAGETKDEPLDALESAADAVGAAFIHVPGETRAKLISDGLSGAHAPGAHGPGEPLTLDLETPLRTYRALTVPLAGGHQVANVAIAVMAAEVRGLNEETIRAGLSKTRWPGRLEWVTSSQPPLLLDCAHNPAGASALARSLRRIGRERCVLVFGAMKDKDFPAMAQALSGSVKAVIATRPRIERAATEGQILAAFRAAGVAAHSARAVPDLIEAVAAARKLAGPDGVVCVAGSIFLVGELKERLGF